MPDRTPNPIIPGTQRDRTGAASILRRALREIDRRWAELQREVLALFEAIPTYAVNDAAAVPVLYGLTPEAMAALSAELQAALERWIASGREPAHLMWWSPYTAEAMQLGAAQAVANLANLSAPYASARSLEAVVYSEPYRNRLAMAQLKSYEHWTGLAAAQRSELVQLIGRAVVDGKNPKAVVTEIAERLEVSRSAARQFAQTDITDALRQARWAEADHARDELGIRTGMLWTSALIPTTRPWHASRNGRVYSTEQVRAFYSERGNRYNCFCAQTECLLDKAGRPILTDKLKAKMLAEREAWEKAQAQK